GSSRSDHRWPLQKNGNSICAIEGIERRIKGLRERDVASLRSDPYGATSTPFVPCAATSAHFRPLEFSSPYPARSSGESSSSITTCSIVTVRVSSEIE